MADSVQSVSIAQEARSRFLRYAMSVVTGRALPDVRDGLKPVQRRILFTMYQDMNLTADRKPAKCAQIVGKVMGDYHPHGGDALYEAMVRMAQDWILRLPLVDGQGNFGSVDGDPPAAQRYTEAKLALAAEAMLGELDQETVDMRDNYTATKKEPVVLPTQFPNLLVNGTSGIAVGMATNIPPHNLGEVIRASIYLIDNRNATTAQLLEKIKGPDFPLGGKILSSKAAIRKIYEEGFGSIKVQGEWKIENLERNKLQIVVTSIPYGVNKGNLELAIGAIIEDRKVPQLLGLSNESNDKDGLRIALELKPGADPEAVMAYLYKHTELQKSISYNMTALVPSHDPGILVPKDKLSLKDILDHFLEFRLQTVRRRYEYHLRILLRRIHILEGFAIIFDDLDKAITIIRFSDGKSDASTKLQAEFPIDNDQANAVLDSQLYKIAKMEIQRITEELKEKRKTAQSIQNILKSEQKLWNKIKSEMEELLEQNYVTRRRTRMASDEDILEFDETAYIVQENTNVIMTRDGWIKRVNRVNSLENTRVREGDTVLTVVPGNTIQNIVFWSQDGVAYTLRMSDIPSGSGYGDPITKYFKLTDQAKVLMAIGTDPRFITAKAKNEDAVRQILIVIVTSAGNVIRIPFAAFTEISTKTGRKYVKLDADDRVVFVQAIQGHESILLVTQQGRINHFLLEEIPVLSGAGKGSIGIRCEQNDQCIGAGILTSSRFDKIQIRTESGKIQDFGRGAIPLTSRGTKGEKIGARTRFEEVLPQEIQLVDWDAVEKV